MAITILELQTKLKALLDKMDKGDHEPLKAEINAFSDINDDQILKTLQAMKTSLNDIKGDTTILKKELQQIENDVTTAIEQEIEKIKNEIKVDDIEAELEDDIKETDAEINARLGYLEILPTDDNSALPPPAVGDLSEIESTEIKMPPPPEDVDFPAFTAENLKADDTKPEEPIIKELIPIGSLATLNADPTFDPTSGYDKQQADEKRESSQPLVSRQSSMSIFSTVSDAPPAENDAPPAENMDFIVLNTSEQADDRYDIASFANNAEAEIDSDRLLTDSPVVMMTDKQLVYTDGQSANQIGVDYLDGTTPPLLTTSRARSSSFTAAKDDDDESFHADDEDDESIHIAKQEDQISFASEASSSHAPIPTQTSRSFRRSVSSTLQLPTNATDDTDDTVNDYGEEAQALQAKKSWTRILPWNWGRKPIESASANHPEPVTHATPSKKTSIRPRDISNPIQAAPPPVLSRQISSALSSPPEKWETDLPHMQMIMALYMMDVNLQKSESRISWKDNTTTKKENKRYSLSEATSLNTYLSLKTKTNDTLSFDYHIHPENKKKKIQFTLTIPNVETADPNKKQKTTLELPNNIKDQDQDAYVQCIVKAAEAHRDAINKPGKPTRVVLDLDPEQDKALIEKIKKQLDPEKFKVIERPKVAPRPKN